MTYRVEIFAIIGSLFIAYIVFEFIRKGKLQERYSLLWFGSSIVLFVLAIWRDLLEQVAAFIGVYYAPSALFIIAAVCGMLLALHFTLVISKLSEENKNLAQEIGLMNEKIYQLEKHAQS